MPDGSCTSRQARFGQRSLVMMASEKVGASAPSSAQAARIPPSTGSRGSSVPMTPVEATTTWSGSMPSASAVAACCASAVSSPRRPSPTFECAALAATARSPPSRAWRDTTTGAPTRALVVKRAAETVPRLVADEHAHVEALGLESRRHARRPEAGRQRVGLELGHVLRALDPARAEEASSGRPLIATAPPPRAGRASGSGPAPPGRPRPSRGCRSRRTRCPVADDRHVHPAAVRVLHVARVRRLVHHVHEGLGGVGLPVVARAASSSVSPRNGVR